MTCARKCRHCAVTIVLHEPSGKWWHLTNQARYRSCRDATNRLIGDHLAEPEEES